MNGSKKYIDYLGTPLLNHDGKVLFVSDKKGYQYFGIDGKGFLHDGSAIELPDGRLQFFLSCGKAIIHDGSPLKLASGKMQYFDRNGMAMWPIDENRMRPLINEQRDAFFNEMVKRINQSTPLQKSEIEDLKLAFLAAEHPDSEESKDLMWSQDDATSVEAVDKDVAGAIPFFEILWSRVWKKYQLRHRETLAARYILYDAETSDNCPLAGLPVSALMLTNELIFEFKKAEKKLPTSLSVQEIENAGVTENGIFKLDQALCDYIKSMKKGEGRQLFLDGFRQLEKEKRFDLKERICAWKHPLFMYRCLAEVIWLNDIRDQAEQAYKKPPALPLIISDTITEFVNKRTSLDSSGTRVVNSSGKELANIDKMDLDHIPSIPMSSLQKILSPYNLKALNSLNYLRIISWEVVTGIMQAVKGQSDARVIQILGGYEEVAHLVGAGRGGKARDQIKKILAWQAATQKYVLYDKYGNEKVVIEGSMIAFERIEGGSRSSALNIVLGTMLLPHSFFKLLKSKSKKLSSEATMLIPLPNSEPNLIGKANTYASQVTFQWNFLAEARKKAKEFAKNGCIYLPKEKFALLAKKSGLSIPFYLRVIDAWLNNGDKPAFLRLIEKDHYALGSASKQLQDFIIDGGKREIALSKAGKRSAEKRSLGVFSKH